jgi:polyhydroxybutyrate depolymerase
MIVASRFLVGSLVLATIVIGLGSAAPAQDRGERVRALMERAREKRDLPSDPNPTRITAPGTYRFHFTYGGIRRDYLVHVPARAIGKPAPVLLALHGGGGDMDYQAQNYGLVEKSDQAGFIFVAPNGTSRFRSGILATWNAGTCCGRAVEQKVDDVGFIRAVIARVATQAPVDLSRVFATGMSNGALMSYRLACEASDLIRAIAPVAGTDNTTACKPSRSVPVIHFHAKDDSHVLFGGGSGPDALTSTNFLSVPSTIAKWVALNKASAQAKTALSVPGAICTLHSGAAPVQLCVTDAGGHSWPGSASLRANKSPSQAISSNDLMWDFFVSLK